MNTLLLSGTWLLSLGSPEPAFPQSILPPPPAAFTDTIELPGTTETRGKSELNSAQEAGGLTRVRKFEGPAWYRRDIEIPANWTGQRLQLHLERTKYTQVWFDDRPIGSQRLAGTPQTFNLPASTAPGRHTLTVLVDNRAARRAVQGQSHQHDDSTQTNWNGLLGQLTLTATDPVWLDTVQLTPDLATRSFHVRATVGNTTGAPTAGTITVAAVSFNHAGPAQSSAPQTTTFACPGTAERTVVEFTLPLGPTARLWDEFDPALYHATFTLAANPAPSASTAGPRSPKFSDTRVVETGLREFRTRDRQFTINGRPTFLRGKHEGCVFPLTGHPPMDVAGWEHYLRRVQEWGFNHLRCHTWVPPEAAFAAADRLGMYLQPELPFWGTFTAEVRDGLMPEAEALLREYGNHPSFVMLTLANEAGGDRAIMNAMVEHLRALDPSRLYADGSNNVLWDPVFQPSNDFFVSAKVKPPADPSRTLMGRGSFCVFDGAEGHTQWGPSETRTDLSTALAGLPVPFVGHETGQWTVYPNFREIPKYTGVLRAHNLTRFRNSLARHGMLDQADDFQRASGTFAAELYREENELLLRTPGCGGFQHLDLQDYPGQGTALVGLLDAFMDPKGFVTAEEFRRSCSPLVPLARFDKYLWRNGETYTADLQLAHYGPADLPGAVTNWSLVDGAGKTVAHGAFAPSDLAQGGLRPLGRVEAPLGSLPAPARYDLNVAITSGSTAVAQSWPVWVYPDAIDTTPPAGVELVRTFDDRAQALLAAGNRVVLVPAGPAWGNTLPGGYATDYWCWPMFNNTPGTMGLLCDPAHPSLARFPSRFHSERQWADIAHAATPVILARTPDALRPLVQVIDNYGRNEKLGLVFEAKVGPGRLLVCAADLLGERLHANAAAQQLLASLLAYAGSDAFAPAVPLTPAALETLLRPSLTSGATTTASSSFTPPWGFVPKPGHAIDSDINTRWLPATDDKSPWFAVDLGALHTVRSLESVWGEDEAGYRYCVEGSPDGSRWETLSDQSANGFTSGRHFLPLTTASAVRHLRISILGTPPDKPAALRELRVLGE